MKYILLTATLYLTCAMAQATPTVTSYDNLSKGANIIAKRLASKTITEVVVIAMKLQIECQQINSKEVCEGVKNILTVLDARLASLPAEPDRNSSVAFVEGLMEGVSDANQESISRLTNIQ